MKKGAKQLIAILLASAMCIGNMGTSTTDAAGKPSLKLVSGYSIAKGQTKTLKLKVSGVKKLAGTKWTTSKKNVVKITKSTAKSTKITGLTVGKSIITANIKYKVSKKSKTLSKKLKCTVRVTKPATDKTVTSTPVAPATTTTPATAATPSTSATPAKPTRTPGAQNLLGALQEYVTNVGSCIAYSSWGGPTALEDADVKAYIKENLNSLTAENEMKPESILGRSANTIKLAAAKAQNIYIPDNYKDSVVPVLNYGNIDTLMKFANDNNIRIRYHGLLWHEQTSNWFFRENFNPNGKYVSAEVMDGRIAYYIYNVMDYVYRSKYAHTVYCWDVVNEFYHMTECICRIQNTSSELDPVDIPKDKPETVKCFYEVYGQDIFENPDDPAHSPVKTNPAYVKKAFAVAYSVLEKYNLTDSVELVYNDYDTNMKEVRETALAVTDYINSRDELNPDGKKLVTTIGMQCHDKLDPRWTVAGHKESMDAFRNAGMNFQVTEMDLNLNGKTVNEQLTYWSDFVKLVINEVKAGAKVTGFTWWGLTDKSSWLGSSGSPLLCGENVKDKKPAYYKVIEAAYSVPID